MPFIDHPLRGRVVSEMHMRRMPPLSPPMTMVQVVRLVSPDLRAEERAHVLAMPDVASDAISERSRHIGAQRSDGTEFLWECHSEASTATVILPVSGSCGFGDLSNQDDRLRWLMDAPGEVLRAVRIAIVGDADAAVASMDDAGFTPAELVSCKIGPVQIWSDFLVRDDNFGRLLVNGGGLDPADLGRLVQQVQELGNYRNLALIGLPLAQEQGPSVTRLEQALVAIALSMEAGNADPMLLDELCGVAAQLTRITAATAYRMSATAAYARIVEDRLQALAGTRIAGFQSLEEFTERRLLPATRTCASFSARLETLSVRVERATSLLRTRVEIAVQAQNAALLSSMDKNAERQLRLQRVVEGLSVVAISYYAVGLLAYLLHAVATRYRLPEEQLIAWSVIPVMVIVWLLLRRKVRAIVDAVR